MGPQLLLDKSALQSLSLAEAVTLGRYYLVVVTPVLMAEILGDLKKAQGAKKRRRTRLRNEAAELAEKLHTISSRSFNIPQRYLNLHNLAGDEVSMSHRPIIGATPVITESGERGAIADDTQEKALFSWSRGQFTEGDQFTAMEWRRAISQSNLEVFQRNIIQRTGKLKIRDLEDLKEKVDHLLDLPKMQEALIGLLVGWSSEHPQAMVAIMDLWNRIERPLLKDFAPYSYHCAHVLLMFVFGLGSRLLGTRATNRIDLEYLFYLPFCTAFSSRDKFHLALAPYYLGPRQTLIPGDDLKADMAAIQAIWDKTPDQQKAELRYPPDIPGSITLNLWKKHMRPREQVLSSRPDLSEEEEAEILRRMREYINAKPIE